MDNENRLAKSKVKTKKKIVSIFAQHIYIRKS